MKYALLSDCTQNNGTIEAIGSGDDILDAIDERSDHRDRVITIESGSVGERVDVDWDSQWVRDPATIFPISIRSESMHVEWRIVVSKRVTRCDTLWHRRANEDEGWTEEWCITAGANPNRVDGDLLDYLIDMDKCVREGLIVDENRHGFCVYLHRKNKIPVGQLPRSVAVMETALIREGVIAEPFKLKLARKFL